MKFTLNVKKKKKKKKNRASKTSNNYLMKRSGRDNFALNCGSIIGFISLSLSLTCIRHFA